MMAAMNGHLSACSALLASGAEGDAVSGHGWTALQKASFSHHVTVIKCGFNRSMQHTRICVSRRSVADETETADLLH